MLETEESTYQKLLPSLMKDEGRYALISGTTLLGVYVAYEDALSEGYKACGLEPFLVKKIASVDQVHYFSRDLSGVCAV